MRRPNKLERLSHDIQHNDIQHNDIQHNDILHNDIQHNDIQHNDIQHKDNQNSDNQHKRHSAYCFAECHYAQSRNQVNYAPCHSAKCRHGDRRGALSTAKRIPAFLDLSK